MLRATRDCTVDRIVRFLGVRFRASLKFFAYLFFFGVPPEFFSVCAIHSLNKFGTLACQKAY